MASIEGEQIAPDVGVTWVSPEHEALRVLPKL